MGSMHTMYDVIVVGAGPAGSVCAYECSKRGLKTLLLDRDPFPRQKPCAGAVAEQALSYLDFPLPPEIIERDCHGATLRLNGHNLDIRKNGRIAVLVSRDRFDAFLEEKAVQAGARFLPGEKVTNIVTHPDSVEVKTGTSSYRASYLIGADGVHSVVARAVRPPFAKSELILALVSSVPSGQRNGNDRRDGALDMHFGIVPMGYGWVFPHAGYDSVGIMGLASDFSDPHRVFTDFTRSLKLNPDIVRGHFIPLGGLRRKIISGRIALVGDAAGLADPFTGEGIIHAIHSGKLAAQSVAQALKTGEGPVMLSAYSRNAERLIRKNLRRALSMARMINRFPDLSRRIFFHNREAMERYLDIPAGRTDYRGFWRWLMPRIPVFFASSLSRSLFRK